MLKNLIKLYHKINHRLKGLYWSIIFSLKNGVYRAKIVIDSYSVRNSNIRSSSKIRGSLCVSESVLNIGSDFGLAKTSQLNIKNGSLKIGTGVSIGHNSIISSTNGSIVIKDRTTFFSDCIVSGNVSIGHDCLIAKNVSILSGTHVIDGRGTIRENDKYALEFHPNLLNKKISIGNDVWLGSNSVILPGVELKNGVVVGANSVVTKSFPEYSIIGGVPAKILRYRKREI